MRSARLLALVLLLCIGGSAASSSYTLKQGDTLSRIATKFKIPVAAITAANDIANPDKVREGQKITVPDKKAAQVAAAKPIATVVTAAQAAPADGSKVYELRAGDTLSAIAKRFETTVADLVERNGLAGADALIREGRSLKLPPHAVNVPAKEAPLCPVKGANKFDFSNSFGSPREGHRFHMGNDIFAKRGAPVIAGVDGIVRTVEGGRAGIGYYLDGADGVTYYGAHLNERKVGDGAAVHRGDVIGTVGSTGNAGGTPAHLHFEIKPGNGTSIDPYPLLRVWCGG
ncbi:MAG TPA: M23 family metallopeptidase [Acidimicrobiales bacterium]|nr:M23 family metallopeptidase [Acidimicrobiales bacterium]